MKVLWVVVAIASVLGGLTLFLTVGDANGAPQEAAGAAIAVALAVIPYCFARALSELRR
jgi:hypothetical protein